MTDITIVTRHFNLMDYFHLRSAQSRIILNFDTLKDYYDYLLHLETKMVIKAFIVYFFFCVGQEANSLLS